MNYMSCCVIPSTSDDLKKLAKRNSDIREFLFANTGLKKADLHKVNIVFEVFDLFVILALFVCL